MARPGTTPANIMRGYKGKFENTPGKKIASRTDAATRGMLGGLQDRGVEEALERSAVEAKRAEWSREDNGKSNFLPLVGGATGNIVRGVVRGVEGGTYLMSMSSEGTVNDQLRGLREVRTKEEVKGYLDKGSFDPYASPARSK